MIFSITTMAIVLGYTWLLAPTAPKWVAALAAVIVVGLAVVHASRSGEWGLERRAFGPALAYSALLTFGAAAVIAAVGARLDTAHRLHDPWATLLPLIPWGLAQQFALQTMFLREAQAATRRDVGVGVAALMFAALHLPNPFLTTATAVGALAWCWVYDRHPNVLPLGASHALLTLAVLYAFDDAVTGRLRVGVAYLSLR